MNISEHKVMEYKTYIEQAQQEVSELKKCRSAEKKQRREELNKWIEQCENKIKMLSNLT